MYMLTSLLVAIVVALLRGGRIESLGQIELRYPSLILTGLAIKFIVFSGTWKDLIGSYAALTRALYIVSLVLVLAGIALNRRLPGFRFVGLGILLNTVAVIANGGYMPISWPGAQSLSLSPLPGTAVLNGPQTQAIIITQNTRLWFLGDVISLPRPLPVHIISLGDIILCTGVFYAVQKIMLARRTDTVEGDTHVN